MYLSVIIPAYNESNRIKKTLDSIHDYLSQQSYDYEILVVNDGSHDDTKNVVEECKKNITNLQLFDNKKNHGKGWVVKHGMQFAKGELKLFMDADNSTTIDQIEGMLPYTRSGYDVIIGSRRIKGATIAVKQPFIRDILGAIFRLIVHTIIPLNVTDSQAGFKMFTKNAADIIFPYQTIFRWAFDVELLTIARIHKLKIKEVPIIWTNDLQSKVKLSGMIKMIFELITIRFNIISHRYK